MQQISAIRRPSHSLQVDQTGSLPLALTAGFLLLATAGVASAAWPRDPNSPLLLGGIEGVGLVEQVTVTTPDGATWSAWVDMQCFGSLRLQRIAADGTLLTAGSLALDNLDGCLAQRAHLAACSDGSVVVSRDFGPVLRVAPDGSSMWGSGIVFSGGAGTLGGLLGLPDGDALIAWHLGTEIFVGRFAPDGSPVWPQPAAIPNLAGPNMRIFALVPDDADGAFVFWDSPGAYTRLIRTARVTAAGEPAWAEPLAVVPLNPGSSRHSDPVAIRDGAGGAALVWTQGSDSGSEPTPMFLQRITPEGTLVFEPEGRRISLELVRQFDPVVVRHPTSGDFFVVWRDGALQPQLLKVQRMSVDGQRLWGDTGIVAAPLVSTGRFDAAWVFDRLAIALSGPASPPDSAAVNVHRVDAAGLVAADPWPISDSATGGAVRCVLVDDALVVTWVRDGPSFDDLIAAQRVNADGRVGLPREPARHDPASRRAPLDVRRLR